MDLTTFHSHGSSTTRKARKPTHDDEELSFEDEEDMDEDPILEEFGVELVQRARDGKIDELIGPRKGSSTPSTHLGTTSRTIRFFLVIPGVGKTAIIEGLAKKIADGDIPEMLAEAEVYSWTWVLYWLEHDTVETLKSVSVVSSKSCNKRKMPFCLSTRFTCLWVQVLQRMVPWMHRTFSSRLTVW